jgi:hypothetical protein
MCNEGFFQLGLRDVRALPVNASNVRAGLVRRANNR